MRLRICSAVVGLENQALTYAFSTENWGRPLEEVDFLMSLFERVLRKELREMVQECSAPVCGEFECSAAIAPS